MVSVLESILSLLKVPSDKVVKVTFLKFYVADSGEKDGVNCKKDYVMVDGKK